MEDNGSLTRVAAFPIGIDPERFAQALEKPAVKAHIAQLLNRYAGRKVRTCSLSVVHILRRLCSTASMPFLAFPVHLARSAFRIVLTNPRPLTGKTLFCKEQFRCR